MNEKELIETEIELWYDYIDSIQYELLQKEVSPTKKMELHFLAAKAKKNIERLENELKDEDK